jgi:predicted PurR-regulated permease PerM
MPTRSVDQSHTISVSTWTILKVIIMLIALGLIWVLRDVVAMIFVALLLSALIDPFADWFGRHHIPRALAVILVYICLLGIGTSIIILLVPPLVAQVQQLVTNFSSIVESLMGTVNRFQAVTIQYGFGENFQSGLQALESGVSSSVSGIFSTVTGFFGSLAALVIVFVLTFYMVVEEDSARRFFKNMAPVEYQPFLSGLFNKMQKRIGYWLRGQLVLGLVVGLAVYVGLLILGVPYALLLGLIAGLLEIVPYAGPMLAAVPVLIIAFSVSPIKGILAIILFIVIQQVENNLLVPKIMQKATGLNPVVSIVAMLVGVKFGGVTGALLAIPVATMASVAIEELFSGLSSEKTK